MTPADAELLETLRLAQRLGFFGSGPVDAAAAHAEQYVTALARLVPGSRVVDLGSGGGLPGLVIARSRPDLALTMIDRREKRTDFLSRAVRRLGLAADVRSGDVADLVEEVRAGVVGRFDAVTARSFGPPANTLRWARALLAPQGMFVVSEPPSGDRWDLELLHELSARREQLGGVSRFTFAS